MNLTVRQIYSKNDKQNAYRFRYEIYVEELEKEHLPIDHTNKLITDNLDSDAIILVVEDDNRIVGTIRANYISDKKIPTTLQRTFPIEKLIRNFDNVLFVSYLMVKPEYRKGMAAAMLLATIYNSHFMQTSIALCYCELPLAKMYKRLGFRQIARPVEVSRGEWRFLMALMVKDYDHLLKVGSPFALSLNPEISDNGNTANLVSKLYPEFDIDGVAGMNEMKTQLEVCL